MDGNRRWAKRKGIPSFRGHRAGAKALMEVCKKFHHFKIPFLTVYAFSAENNKRNQEEKTQLFAMLEEYLDGDIQALQKNEVKVQFIGDFSIFSQKIQEKISQVNNFQLSGFNYTFTVALNYGGRHEIVEVCKKIAKENHEICEEEITRFINKKIPEVDFLIRTGGMQRLSNFLLWHSAYAELYFEEALWPEFSVKEIEKALAFFVQQKRNFGN